MPKDPGNYPIDMVDETLKFGGGNLLIKDCISCFGVIGMSNVVGRMNSDQLLKILDTCLVPSINEVAKKLFPNARNNIVFQQDNDSKLTSGATQN